eukprot:7338-Heterococcus_DN1.PRE.2
MLFALSACRQCCSDGQCNSQLLLQCLHILHIKSRLYELMPSDTCASVLRSSPGGSAIIVCV